MKPKKVTRQRGHKTHGWGSKKKHRGAGNRGGRGNAGSGKRADQKKPSYWDNRVSKRSGQKHGQDYFGKRGFGMNATKDVVAITLRDLDAALPKLVLAKQASEKSGVFTVDLSIVGYGKLLGTGRIGKKVQVTVAQATAGALEKIRAAGGSVTLTASAESATSGKDAAKADDAE